MMFRNKIAILIFVLTYLKPGIKLFAQKPIYTFKTFAGSVDNEHKDGPREHARLRSPEGIAMDTEGNLFITEYRSSIVRKINAAGEVTLFAGKVNETGFKDGQDALFDRPHGAAVDKEGNVYVCDMKNHLIRKITKNGFVSTYAGTPKISGATDGPANMAQFNQPEDLAFDSKGNLYIADSYNFTIRKITKNGIVSTLAGTTGKGAYKNGPGSVALFNKPLGICVDVFDNLYIADADYDGKEPGNCLVRKIDLSGRVSTYAGVPTQDRHKDGPKLKAHFNRPVGIEVDMHGNIYIADTEADLIRMITKNGEVITLGGQYLQELSQEGIGEGAAFFDPQSLVISSNGNLFITDTHNNKIIIGTKINESKLK